MVDEAGIRTRYQAIVPLVDERARRLFAGAEALAVGYGGVSGVARATGMSRQTVSAGLNEVQAVIAAAPRGRMRREGGGRPRTVDRDTTLRSDLESLIEPTSRGDPQSPRRWTSAKRLLITADGGGSNGPRVRLWKLELQKPADETGLEMAVCHFPPGTSKWNKIEHRLFSAISQTWRGQAPRQPRGDREPDRRNDDQGGAEGPQRTRQQRLPGRTGGERRRDGNAPPPHRRIPCASIVVEMAMANAVGLDGVGQVGPLLREPC